MSRIRVLSSVELEFGGASPAGDLIREAGFELAVEYGGPHWADAHTRAKLAGVDAILAGGENFNAATLARAGRLRVIARNGVGYDKIDLALCTERGIVVTYTPGVMADAVADLSFALLLALVRRLPTGDRNVKTGTAYEVPIGEDLAAMTLGLLGCGRIGAEVVRRALAFKMRVLVCDPWVEEDAIAALGARPVPLDELLPSCDALSLHIPLNAENRGLVDAAFLARMKEGSLLINTARGALIEERALLAALRSGHLAGAGLDCQASEPPAGTSLELVRLEQVISMPHAGSKTLAARRRMSVVAAQSIVDVLQGRTPAHVVNPEVLDSLG